MNIPARKKTYRLGLAGLCSAAAALIMLAATPAQAGKSDCPGDIYRSAVYEGVNWRHADEEDLAKIDPAAADHDGFTPLHIAILHSTDAELIDALIAAGADANAASINGNTPLMAAACAARPETVGNLLKRGAKVGAVNEQGFTALHYASMASNAQSATILLAAGASVETASNKGTTPLHLAAEHCRQQNLEILLAAGATVDAASAKGRTPLHLASSRCKAQTLKTLLKAGADSRTRTGDDETLLHLAVCNSRALDFVLTLNPEINARATDGRTPLHWAAQSSHRSIDRLIDRGADPEIGDANGATALHLAAKAGNDKAVQKLIAAGADPNAADTKGDRPIDLARKEENLSAYLYLLFRQIKGELGLFPGIEENHD